MNTSNLQSFQLIGLSLNKKTTNENGQANIDCGGLWQAFITGNYAEMISGKLDNDILAVYHDYDGDYTQPFAYFIGCRVENGTEVPAGMDSLTINAGKYQHFLAKGQVPDCIAKVWQEIWNADMNRAYGTDFEVYYEKSQNWSDAEIDVYISVK